MKIPNNATDFELWQYRLIKTFWESDSVAISKKHPALMRRKKQADDSELSAALVNRFKNYGRTKLEDNGSKIYLRSAYLDDLFALCSATNLTPNDVLMDTVCSKINSFDTVYDIWVYLMKAHYDEKFFSQISIKKEDLSIKLPHNSDFIFNLILNIDFYFEEVFKYSIQQHSIIEVKYRIYKLCNLFDNSDLDEIMDTIQFLLQESDNKTHRNLVNCRNFWDSLQPYWKFCNNTFDSFNFSYGKWNKEHPFYLSFSLFVVYATFVSIEKTCRKREMTCDEFKDFLNNDLNKEIRTLILSLLRNSFCFINDNTFIACNGNILNTYERDSEKEYDNIEELSPHSKGSIIDIASASEESSYK